MKRLSILFSLFMCFVLSQSVWAYKQADVKKLLDTNSCPICDLKDAVLIGAKLSGANLGGADLHNAKLQGADLSHAFLGGAVLKGADLRNADLRHADLRNAYVYWADVSGANLSGANLRGGDFLHATNIPEAIFCNTTMTDGKINNSGCAVATTPTTPVKTIFKLTIRSNVSGYAYIDGKLKGLTPVSINVPKGLHNLRVDMSGYYLFERTVNVQKDTEIYTDLIKKEPIQVTLTVTANIGGAEVQIDGKHYGYTPAFGPVSTKVKKGLHTVTVSKTGYHSYVETINVTTDRKIVAHLLEKEAPQPVLTIRSNVSGYVYINSQPKVCCTPIEIKVSKGRYTVKVDKSGYYSFQKSVNVQRDTEIYAALTKKEETQPTPTPDSSSLRLAGTGTAFVVNKNYLLTASHVIDECKEVSIRHSHEEADVAIAAWDETNDLGLLKSNKSFQYTAKFRDGKPIRKGDTVVNYGYPLFGELSDAAKISRGEINALAGWGNDSRHIQYDAATQPGNSGGPVLDLSGNVVGIVSAGLSKKYAEQSGHIAQNVNFAVKSYVAEGFLSANGVAFERAESIEKMETADIAEKAERFTVLVGCWQ